mmetsp:Transcript_66289/g.178389  ORF Transcript_66289/g.178389 Transcript_66289/m.178389 type:complete len:81 (-) Transcript_66289:817-1059(-)
MQQSTPRRAPPGWDRPQSRSSGSGSIAAGSSLDPRRFGEGEASGCESAGDGEEEGSEGKTSEKRLPKEVLASDNSSWQRL